jgi:hypothetical protein
MRRGTTPRIASHLTGRSGVVPKDDLVVNRTGRPVRGSEHNGEVRGPAPCGCRRLVRTADLQFCPGNGHVCRASGNCAIHPNLAAVTRLGSAPERWLATESGTERFRGIRGGSDGRAHHGLSELGTGRGHRDESERSARNACSGRPDEFSAPTGSESAVSRCSRLYRWPRNPLRDSRRTGGGNEPCAPRESPVQDARTSFRD